MEQNYTYLFQELYLLNQQQKKLISENNSQFIGKLHEQIFRPQAHRLNGKIIKEHGNRSIMRFNRLDLAEDYLSTTDAILIEFRNQKREFYIETASYVWCTDNESLTSNEVKLLKRISDIIRCQSGVYCSQKLALKSFVSDKIIEQDGAFYLLRLIKSESETKPIKPRKTALKTLLFILTLGALVISYKWLSTRVKLPANNLQYQKLIQNMNDQEPGIINQKLRKLANKTENNELENLLLEYVKLEWRLFSRFPDNATNDPISRRISELSDLFPWSSNLIFFNSLLKLYKEHSTDKVPSAKVDLVYKSTKDMSIAKTLIFVEFCIRFNTDPYFLITDLKKLGQNDLESIKNKFLRGCLMHSIIGKEPQLVKWINHFSDPEILDNLENWITDSDQMLSKNSFMLLVELNEMNGIIAKTYIEKKLRENQKPLQEIHATSKLTNQSDREILSVYFENLLIKLKRQDAQKELEVGIKEVLNKWNLN